MGARSTPNVYSPSSGDVTIAGATAVDQFGALVHNLGALCGWASGEILYAWQNGTAVSKQGIYQIFQQANANGDTVGPHADQGVSTAGTVSQELTRAGVPNYVTNNWQQALQQFAMGGSGSVRPIELGVQSPTHNLGDPSQLAGDEYGVTGHFITVEGWSPMHNAYIVSDPDNAAAKSGNLVYYTLQQLRNAGAERAVVPTGAGAKGYTGGNAAYASAPVYGGPAGGIGTAAGSVGAAASGVGNALSSAADLPGAIAALPGNLVAAFQADIINAGFLFFAAMLMLIGVLLLIGPQAVDATKQAAKAAAVAE